MAPVTMRGRPGRAIVVGYADSEASRRALTVAAELAADLGARLAVVHVVDLRDYPADPDLPDWEGAGAARLAAERTEVEGILANWSGQWTYELVRGEPARAIADIAAREHARMIVVGSRGGSGFGAALDRVLSAARSVTHSLERADTPVLVVPAHSAPKTGKPGARP